MLYYKHKTDRFAQQTLFMIQMCNVLQTHLAIVVAMRSRNNNEADVKDEVCGAGWAHS